MTNQQWKKESSTTSLEKRKGQMNSLQHALTASQGYWSQAIPATMAKVLTAERVTKIIMVAAARLPQLLECSTTSIVKSTTELVALGLEPAGPLGHAYLVPFWNNKLRSLETQ